MQHHKPLLGGFSISGTENKHSAQEDCMQIPCWVVQRSVLTYCRGGRAALGRRRRSGWGYHRWRGRRPAAAGLATSTSLSALPYDTRP